MGMAHELGLALFDITEQAILDYYSDPDEGPIAGQRIKRLAEQARAEGVVLLARMLSLAASYAALLAQHNNTPVQTGGGSAGAGAGAGAGGQQPAAAGGAGASGSGHAQQQAPALGTAAAPVTPSSGSRGATSRGEGPNSRRPKRTAAVQASAAIKRHAADNTEA